MDPIQEALDVLLGSPHLVLRDIGVGDATWEVLICPGDGGLGAEGYRPLASKLSAKVGGGETSEMLHFSQIEWMTSIPLLFGGAMYKVIMNMIHTCHCPPKIHCRPVVFWWQMASWALKLEASKRWQRRCWSVGHDRSSLSVNLTSLLQNHNLKGRICWVRSHDEAANKSWKDRKWYLRNWPLRGNVLPQLTRQGLVCCWDTLGVLPWLYSWHP